MNMKMLDISAEHGLTHPTLLWDDDDLVLVDTSFPLCTDAICQAITAAGQNPARLTKIILTHQDLDHMGCVRDFMGRHPSIEVLCEEHEAPYIQGDQIPVKLSSFPEDNMFRQAYARRVVPIAHKLKDGERLPICGGIRVIHTPGHTPGHCCLYIESERALIAGDALNARDGMLFGPNPQHTLDMAQGFASLRKLLPLDIAAVYTFHGGVYDGDVHGALEALTREAIMDKGPFYHGTKADLTPGDLLDPGYNSNYGKQVKANFVYMTGTMDAAIWGAELALGDGPGHVYRVEPTGAFEDDPNLTNQKFPGNRTRSYRTREPLRIMGEVTDWLGHPPEVIKNMLDNLETLKQQGVEAIND